MSTKEPPPSNYPESNINLHQMNRVVRHRLRNLCAGVKMTMDRIAQITADTHPQLTPRCDVVKNELNNLQLFTERLDLVFDTPPTPAPRSLFEVIAALRTEFSKAFPFCNLLFDGPQAEISFKHGSWLFTILQELLANAAEAAALAEQQSIAMSWQEENGLTISISNPGTIPAEIPTQPPQPFITRKSRHDGIGLAIAYRLSQQAQYNLAIASADDQVTVTLQLPEQELVKA